MSVVYKVNCACGKELEVNSVYLDGGDDLCVVVEVCSDCMDEVREEGVEEGKSSV